MGKVKTHRGSFLRSLFKRELEIQEVKGIIFP